MHNASVDSVFSALTVTLFLTLNMNCSVSIVTERPAALWSPLETGDIAKNNISIFSSFCEYILLSKSNNFNQIVNSPGRLSQTYKSKLTLFVFIVFYEMQSSALPLQGLSLIDVTNLLYFSMNYLNY